MATYWITEALPSPVTSLIPVFAFPLLGIMPSDKVCLAYMDETNMMFLGGLMVSIAVEHCNLHRRIALFTMLKIGQSPRRLVAGFMVATMFISMWISNTATTAMMIPILDAILQELFKTSEENTVVGINSTTDGHGSVIVGAEGTDPTSSQFRNSELVHHDCHKFPNDKPQDYSLTERGSVANSKREDRFVEPVVGEEIHFKNLYYLVAAYASSIGGTGSLMGTGTNLVVKGILDSSFTEPSNLNFSTWLAFNVPGMLLCTFLGCLWLQIRYIGIGRWSRVPKSNSEQNLKIKQLILEKYQGLGDITFHEMCVLSLFVLQVLLWFFREPNFMTGWASLLINLNSDAKDLTIGDSFPAILVVVILFVLPARPNFGPFKDKRGQTTTKGPSPGCLTWDIIQAKLPWGIILLLGGGFVLAKGSTSSGLSLWLGQQLKGIAVLPPSVSVLIITVVSASVTEITSNTAVASLILPVLKDLALEACVNPLYFMLPATVACSYAFMLPVGTPPNALVHQAANMKTSEMIRAGIVMKIICLIVINVMVNTLGVAIFDIKNMPSWANATTTGNSVLKC